VVAVIVEKEKEGKKEKSRIYHPTTGMYEQRWETSRTVPTQEGNLAVGQTGEKIRPDSNSRYWDAIKKGGKTIHRMKKTE